MWYTAFVSTLLYHHPCQFLQDSELDTLAIFAQAAALAKQRMQYEVCSHDHPMPRQSRGKPMLNIHKDACEVTVT